MKNYLGALLFATTFFSSTSFAEESTKAPPLTAAEPKKEVKATTPAAAAPKKEVKAAPPTTGEPKKEPVAKPNIAPTSKETAAQKTQVDLSKLADLIQKQYNQTKSATFRFEQMYQHPFLASQEASKGEVSYNKTSGSMMWNYVEPKSKQKQFFINRNKFTYYSLSDKIAYTHDCYDKDTLSASVTFLLGTGNLKESFTIAPFEGAAKTPGLSWLSLLPKEKNAPVKKISFGANAQGRVVESIVEDPSGGKNHFKFIDYKANPKIAESVFTFKAPPDVIVQPMPNIQCTPPQAEPAKANVESNKKNPQAAKK